MWYGDDSGTLSDASLIVAVAHGRCDRAGHVTFSHKLLVRVLGGTTFDGGVIEILDRRRHDVGRHLDARDAAVQRRRSTTTSDNPLGGRAALVGRTRRTRSTDTVTLDLGTALAGKTFRLRFRIGTDGGTGAPGWDDRRRRVHRHRRHAVPEQIGDDGICGGGGGSGDDDPLLSGGGGCCDAGSFEGSGALSLAALALLLRRRRR